MVKGSGQRGEAELRELPFLPLAEAVQFLSMDSERGHGRKVLGVRLAGLGLGLQMTRHILALTAEDIGCLGLSLILRHRRDAAVISVVLLPTVLDAGEC